jgi:dihydrofolate reductase
VLTQKELALYDGSDPKKNIYLAIKGEVFDVTAGRPYYSKGGGYGFFSGKDASRAYTTGCFQTHLTHDLRGLTAEQLAVRSLLLLGIHLVRLCLWWKCLREESYYSLF